MASMLAADVPRKLAKARELALDGNHLGALALYKKVVQHRPQNIELWLEYGASAVATQNLDLAEYAWRRIEALHGNHPDVLQSLGFQYQGARRLERARECFKKAVSVDPQHINSRINLALAFEKTHHIDEARAMVEQCLKIDRRDEQARYLSAFLDVRSNRYIEAESKFRDLLASSPRHEYVRYAARFKLAEICDRTQRFDEAMRLLLEAKAIVQSLADQKVLARQYDWAADDRVKRAKLLPATILEKWSVEFPECQREPIPRIAFVGGHPRSGTTLLEQIIGAHHEVAAADEPDILRWAIHGGFSLGHRISSNALNIIRKRYIKLLVQNIENGMQGQLLLEKNPSLTAMLPVLLRLFPEMHVIIALRDPRDVILSCYFQNIPLNNVNANFLSFDRLVKHYNDVMGIWLSVREWSGFNWIETRYEDTVANVEKEGRRVTNYLGLDWDARQAKFFDESGKTQVYSPTYYDVTKPIYSSSIGRWRHYEKYMTSILPALDKVCSAFNYL